MNSPSANSRVSPGRNGKNNPHSTKTMTMLIHRNAPPNSLSSHSGSSHLIPNSRGSTSRSGTGSAVTSKRYLPDLRATCRTGVADSLGRVVDVAKPDDQDADERAPYDPM